MERIRIILATAPLWITVATLAFAANPQIATWKLDESKSKFSSGATKNQTVSYTEAKGGMINVTVDGTDKEGKAVHWTVQCKFDGKPYKVEGNPSLDTITYKTVNDHTNKITGTKEGKTIMSGTITVSKDGKSRLVNVTTTGADGKKTSEKAYYEKQ